MNETKKKILLAAMKLFSKTSFHQTSMQQIADVCSLSKGSLYIHFKSKEALLSDIFTYYYQVLHDQIAAAKEEADSLQEDFIREIAIRTRHYCAFQEFFMMQLKEIRGLENSSLNEFVRRENLYLMKRTEQRIVDIYGDEIRPFAADLTASLKGLMISYLREIVEKESRYDFDLLALYLFQQIDASAKWMLDQNPEPFFSSYLDKLEEPNRTAAHHPLHFIKKLKELTAREEVPAIAIDSIAILEKELLDLKPREAILNGMLFNLKGIPSMKVAAEELEQAVQKMPETIHL